VGTRGSPTPIPRASITPATYFRAAFDLLGEEGYGGLKLSALCGRLGITTGSFYHHFGGWSAFVEELLAHWEAEQTERVLKLSRAAPEAVTRVRTMKELTATTVPHAAEAAIRMWGGGDARVRQVQDRIDELRIAALSEILGGVIDDAAQARRLAVLGISIMIGWQQLRQPRETSELMELFDEFEATVLRYATGHPVPRPR
jgi:AcrR family transcriptional regulator